MLERLHKKCSDWTHTHPYGHAISIIGALFVGTYFLATVITTLFPELSITDENARYFISASNQIQATILAIVISLTLLAVEMTASKYSPRVIEIFKKNASLWVFLSSYALSITIGSIFLLFIGSPNFPVSTTTGTFFLLSLGIILIFMFIPYVLSTLEFLNPEKTIKRLADLVNVNSISPQVDPFQSVFDVIYGAIKINDFTTMSTGLICAEERFKELVTSGPANWQDDYVLFRFFDDIKRCGFLLIENKEDKYAFEIINRLDTINEWAFKEQNTLILNRSCRAIEEIAFKACESGLVSVVDRSLTILKETSDSIEGIEGLSQDDEVTIKWSCTLFSFVESISNIGKASVRQDLNTSARKVGEMLNALGRSAIEKNLFFKDDFIFKRISAIVLESLKQDKTTLVNSSIQTLQFLGAYSIRHDHSKEALWTLDELKEIGKYAAHQKKAQVVQSVVDAIRYIAIVSIKNQMNETETIALDLIVKFQVIFPSHFKGENKIRLFDYGSLDSITISKKEYDLLLAYESFQLEQYLQPPDDYDESYDESYDDETLVISL
ncbi:DUF2254 domain-containing protein [Methanofollis formosanus]|uniref:DUF2254 domain-containing protein n=1 Tax=Methanofollis formosanus TaxID=299308 RepID=A0A8G1A211_9EURY|nr:DUF2254 family protein [Methanofollis formosanus]QYZ78642.1 DUF2254 domain-containing protein [Methanofollis formosanus]